MLPLILGLKERLLLLLNLILLDGLPLLMCKHFLANSLTEQVSWSHTSSTTAASTSITAFISISTRTSISSTTGIGTANSTADAGAIGGSVVPTEEAAQKVSVGRIRQLLQFK